MAVDDDLAYALRGRPSLRRRLRGVDTTGFADALSGIDPRRFRSLYRDRLSELTGYAEAAAPIDQRMQLEEQLRDSNANLTSSQREILQDRLRRNPARFGSVAASNNPYRYGSVASEQFPTLFRR